MKEKRAWFVFLSSNNYYLYMLLGVYKDLLDTNTKYPIYCGVTPDVNTNTRSILEKVGLKLINLDTSIIDVKFLANAKSKNSEHYYKAFTKLTLFDTKIAQMFDKVVYIDTDVQILKNIDDVFDYPHMAAIEDVAPSRPHSKYTLGCSIFCSGMFVWDFKNNPDLGHKILTELPKLDQNIAWHDQNVLNYYYQDWYNCPELHIPPEYGLMNVAKNFNLIKAPIKAIHYVSRLKTDWPFNCIKQIGEHQWKYGNVHFKEWIESLANTVDFFNNKYRLSIPRLHPENIKLLTKEEECTIVADGRPNTYLYF